jgi:hypothetical protein
MKSTLLAMIAAAGILGISAAAQAAPVSGMQAGMGLTQDAITQVRMSPRERMMRERIMRQRAMHHRRMRHR